jgi:6-phosphogluconate dehydrogenase
MQQQQIGLIGLAVMGSNLILNMERNGFSAAVYNRTESTTTAFMQGPAAGKNITAAATLKDLVDSLESPRVIVIMVKAGEPVDDTIARLAPYLRPGDVVIDGGNAHFEDTERRSKAMQAKGIHFMGVGISGGEEGALMGPSIMPGGPKAVYDLIEPMLTAISAKVNGEPCVAYMGPRGAGHFVKMVHNAIEYGDMQLIAEAYDILHRGLALSADRLQNIFSQWDQGPLSSYLIEITSKIVNFPDEETRKPLVDMIADQAEQKGTGRWASHAALDLGVPIPTIHAAVEARAMSSDKGQRTAAARLFTLPAGSYTGDLPPFIDALGDALYASKICSYAQGMALLGRASDAYRYELDYGEIARIWRGGCIIRARFLDDIRRVFNEDPALANLLVAPFFHQAITERSDRWRHVVQTAVQLGIPTPAMSASLAYFDAYRSRRLPASLIQAQRDYFGAHTYRRIDRDGYFHTKWPA